MKKNNSTNQQDDDLKDEYDFSRMTILPLGRFDLKRRVGSNVVLLEPDVAKAFPDDEAVNAALRLLIKVSELSRDANR